MTKKNQVIYLVGIGALLTVSIAWYWAAFRNFPANEEFDGQQAYEHVKTQVEFGPRSPSTVDQQSVIVSGSQVQVLFAAEDEAMDYILPYLADAKNSIHFMAFSFTYDTMEVVITDRYENGVDVMGVFEKTGSSTEYSELGDMYCSGMKVRRDGNGGFLHHKVVVVDKRIVITGSLNFSDNANDSNDENVLIVDNALS